MTSNEFDITRGQCLMYGDKIRSKNAEMTSVGPPVADTINLTACGVLCNFLRKYSRWILASSGLVLRAFCKSEGISLDCAILLRQRFMFAVSLMVWLKSILSYMFSSCRWRKPSWMYWSLLITVMPDPLSTCLIIMLWLCLRSLMAKRSSLVMLERWIW